MLEELGRFDEAEAAYREASGSGVPEPAANAAVNLGSMLKGLGRLEGAEAAYRQAIDSDVPEQASKAAFNLGNMLIQLGRVSEAAALGERVLQYALSLEVAGDVRAAFDWYGRASDLGSGDGAFRAGRLVVLSGRDDAQSRAVVAQVWERAAALGVVRAAWELRRQAGQWQDPQLAERAQRELSRLEYHDGDERTWADDPLPFGDDMAAPISSAQREVPPSGTPRAPQASHALPADYAGWDRKTREKFVLEMMSRTPGHTGHVGIRAMDRLSGDPSVIPALTEVMSQEPESKIRLFAARGLARMTDRAAIPGLLIALGESDNAARAWAIRGLGRLRAQEAIEPLTALLRSRRDRSAAARALEQIGP
jgi:tetratricopeptide (TPR) repeat protein